MTDLIEKEIGVYESPIELIDIDTIVTAVEDGLERYTLEVIKKQGVNVDKEELLKALRYDRQQYEKGFADGVNSERKHGDWMFVERRESQYDVDGAETWGMIYECSVCNFHHIFIENHISQYKYCPQCGAKMVEEE